MIVQALDKDLTLERQRAERRVVADVDVGVDTRDAPNAVPGRAPELVHDHVDRR